MLSPMQFFPAQTHLSLLCFLFSLVIAETSGAVAEEKAGAGAIDGQAVYAAKCASCHGHDGTGTPDVPQPLFGDRSTFDLADVITRTMPDGEPENCVGNEATAVAEWMQQAFYSPEAQARINPPRIELSRLTVSQYRNSVADLAMSFRWFARPNERRGLEADYYASRNQRGDRRVFRQIDPTIDFNYGKSSPDGEKIHESEFSMRWQGSLIVNETGSYDFLLKTENAGRLFVNDRETPLIDAWVRSGSNTEFTGSRFLLAGRLYPITLEWFKFKEPTSSVSLQWKPPHGVFQVIPARNLTTESAPAVLVIETPFPPDDRSSGYERGTSVSREWDDATTYAAIEAADKMLAMLPDLIPTERREDRSGRRDGQNRTSEKPETSSDERITNLKNFAGDLVERAFRRSLTDEQKRLYVDQQFEATASPDDALRRVILLALKSPRFLYQETPAAADSANDEAFVRASRLSFALLDSIPDKPLLDAAKNGQLQTEQQIRDQAWRLVGDPRSRTHLLEFLRSWMNLSHLHDIDKDHTLYPGFSREVATDMRTSLELLLEQVVTSDNPDFRRLLTTDSTFMNRRLAEFYQQEVPTTDEFREVQFEPDRRAGILTHPLLLSGFSYQSTSSPIHRGVFLYRGVLGRALKPPPEAVAPTAPDLAPDLTTRERVHLQTSPQSCANCHLMINGLGFSLENFDAVGRYRETEMQKTIDAAGSYRTRSGEEVRFRGARELARFLADSPETHRSFVRQLFHHMVQQPILAFGSDSIQSLGDFFASHEFALNQLMVEIACRSALRPNSPPVGSDVASPVAGSQ